MIKSYELALMFSAKKSDAAIKDSITAIKKQLDEKGAKIVKEEAWGKRTLTYDINHESEAIYHIMMIEIEGSAIIELKNEMNLEASALRYLFTLLPDAYQEVADQQVVEIVDDVVNFGERNTKQATSNPMGNPDKSKRMNNRRDQEKKKEVEASADTKKLDAKLADILEK